MSSATDLLEIIKQICKNATESLELTRIDYAEVKSVSPLKLDFGEYTISENDELLVISDRIKMLAKGKIKLEIPNCVTGAKETKECTFIDPKPLKAGDCVACIQEQGGEGWVVIDRVEVDE